jgi:hypothetical protein
MSVIGVFEGILTKINVFLKIGPPALETAGISPVYW